MADAGITFTPIDGQRRGAIASLLLLSYQELVTAWPRHWAGEKARWVEFDRAVFDQPDTVGACTFLTSLDGRVVGFGSYDPREAPACVRVGHNCILPVYRGLGYGVAQMSELSRRAVALGVRRVVVTTSEHPFFRPAWHMYRACGFDEVRRGPGGPDPDYGEITLEMRLSREPADATDDSGS